MTKENIIIQPRRITIRVFPDMMEAVEKLAKQKKWSINTFIVDLIENHLINQPTVYKFNTKEGFVK